MTLVLAAGLVLAGLALLAFGGEVLVRGATTLARAAGLTPAVVGLTVVAMGTSLPEFAVSLMASLQGSPDIAVANVVGSNIWNVLLVLGPTALVCNLPVLGQVVRLEWPFMFFATLVSMMAMHDGSIDRLEGAAMAALLVGFVAYMVGLARREVHAEEEKEFSEEQAAHSAPDGKGRPWLPVLFVAVGCALLFAGGRSLVTGAVEIARLAGLTERVIGLTVVAFGTSAPELAASLVAARRGHADVAVGNLIGSNIFNLLGILGVSAAILPLSVAPSIVRVDMWWMAATSLLLLPLMLRGRVVSHRDGAMLTLIGLVYVAVLFWP
jgi:cation:H+ antiporter